MKHSQLVAIGAEYCHGQGLRVVITELRTRLDEEPDVFATNGSRSMLLEIKVSRGDFAKDLQKWSRSKKRSHFGVGQYRYYLAPAGLLKSHELPDGWGLLELPKGTRKASGIRMVTSSATFTSDRAAENMILVNTLCRLPSDIQGVNINYFKKTTTDTPRASVYIQGEE